MATYNRIKELRRCSNTVVMRPLCQRVSCFLAVRRHLGVHGTRRHKILTASVCASSQCRGAVAAGHVIFAPNERPFPRLPWFFLPSVRRLRRTLRNSPTAYDVAAAAAASDTAVSATTAPSKSKTRPPIRTDRGRKVELPEGVHGVVLREKPCPELVREENEDVTSFWAAETSFRNVTVRKQEATCPSARSLLVVLFFIRSRDRKSVV